MPTQPVMMRPPPFNVHYVDLEAAASCILTSKQRLEKNEAYNTLKDLARRYGLNPVRTKECDKAENT